MLDALQLAIETYKMPNVPSPLFRTSHQLPPDSLTKLVVLVFSTEEVQYRQLDEKDEKSPFVPHFEWYNKHDPQVVFHFTKVTASNPITHEMIFTMMQLWKPHLILTIGPFSNEFFLLGKLPFQVRRLWLHWDKWDDIHPIAVESAIQNGMFNHHLDPTHPLISVVSTAYKSGDRILRPYLSLLRQSYDYWEFVVILDDDDESTWATLQFLQSRDCRVRVYRPSIRAGRIGEAKRDAFMLARGKVLVEIDHDDELSDDCLKWLR